VILTSVEVPRELIEVSLFHLESAFYALFFIEGFIIILEDVILRINWGLHASVNSAAGIVNVGFEQVADLFTWSLVAHLDIFIIGGRALASFIDLNF